MKQYGKPGALATIGLVLGLVGLADLPAGVQIAALILAAVVLVGAGIWTGVVMTGDRTEARIRAWVEEEIAGGRRETDRSASTAELRIAVAELLEELTYIDARVAEDSENYWASYTLPVLRWQEHGKLIAATDHEAHAAVSAAYREADRLNHCVATKSRIYGPMGDYDELYTVSECEPEPWSNAFEKAKDHLHRLREQAPLPFPGGLP